MFFALFEKEHLLFSYYFPNVSDISGKGRLGQKNTLKKMFNQDEGKIECAVGNREMGVLQGKKTEIVLISFLTS